MATLRNLARVHSATVGAGALTLGAAVTGFLTFAQAGVLNGETVSYGIFDYDGAGNHIGSEAGRGVYNAGAGTLTRNVLDSTNGGAALVLSGNEHVFITILTEDMDHASGSIANVGTNTHTQIDTHIADVLTNPHNVTAAQVGAPALVNPSVADNFVSFSNITGGQKDSGSKASDFEPAQTKGNLTATSPLAFNNTRQVIGGAAEVKLGVSAADKMIYSTALDTWVETTVTAFARSILDDVDEATFKATVNLEIGTDVQAYDSTLAGIAALADAAGTLTNNGAGVLSWAAAGAGDIIEGGAGGVAGQLAQFVTDDKHIEAAKIIGPAVNILTLTNAAAATLAINVTVAKTLTLTSTGNYNAAFNGDTASVGTGLTLGSSFVGNWIANAAFAVFTHATVKGTTESYALLQSSSGGTFLNTATGTILFLRVGNADRAQITTSAFNIRNVPLWVGSTYYFIAQGDYAGSGEIPANSSFMQTASTGNMVFTANSTSSGSLVLVYKTSGGFKSAFEIPNSAGTTSDLLLMKSRLGNVSIGNTSPQSSLHVTDDTTTTNAVLEIQRIEALVSTAATGGANGFGVSQTFYAETATDGTSQIMGRIATVYIDSTNATRKSALFGSAYDTAEREGWRVEASGTAPKLSFYGGTTVVRGAALTTQLTTITYTAPGTPDYAVQDFVDVSLGAGWAFANHDEANSVLAVIANLQIRVAELEARLGSSTGVNLFA